MVCLGEGYLNRILKSCVAWSQSTFGNNNDHFSRTERDLLPAIFMQTISIGKLFLCSNSTPHRTNASGLMRILKPLKMTNVEEESFEDWSSISPLTRIRIEKYPSGTHGI